MLSVGRRWASPGGWTNSSDLQTSFVLPFPSSGGVFDDPGLSMIADGTLSSDKLNGGPSRPGWYERIARKGLGHSAFGKISLFSLFQQAGSQCSHVLSSYQCFSRHSLVFGIAKISPFITLSLLPVFRGCTESQLFSLFQQASSLVFNSLSAPRVFRICTDLSFSHCFGNAALALRSLEA
jgi:hypothetical protein